jgi:tellurite resistance protein TerC
MGTIWHWLGFNLFVLAAVALDLGVFHRAVHQIRLREAALWSSVWIALSIFFGLGVLHWYGAQPALEFFTGYLIEKSLSVDNLFVFLVIFRAFNVDVRYQHRVLAWGILAALVMRGAMIAAGAALLARFSWITYLFGAFLFYAALHMLRSREKEFHPEQNTLFLFAKKHLRVADRYHEEHFFFRDAGRWIATPLLLVLLVVEITDVTFALDSIPAIFGITRNAFIVYSSNVFAILGLRALYFLLARVLDYFRYLNLGLSAVLLFIGAKMIAEAWLHIPTHVSLLIVGGLLGLAIAASLLSRSSRGAASTPARAGGASTAPAAVSISSAIHALLGPAEETRALAAAQLFHAGRDLAEPVVSVWRADAELAPLLGGENPDITVGIAVSQELFARVRAANGSPLLARVPPDQDAAEFELHFPGGVSLDILTTTQPGGTGAIASYLAKFGEGIQQVEYRTTDVDLATKILTAKFGLRPVYPEARPGADGTRINFFLVNSPGGAKVLIELYQR